MSRIFFISTNVTLEPYPVYPLGMAVVASDLTARGHTVRQFDYLACGQSMERLVAELKAFDPEFVCLSLRNIDNVDSFSAEDGWYLAAIREMVRCLRAATSAPLIVGGPGFSIMPETILEYIDANYGVVGEGEKVLADLISELKTHAMTQRLVGAGRQRLNGQSMPAPLFCEPIVNFYRDQGVPVGLQTKRGCPFACAYCTYPMLEGHRFRFRETGAVVEDILRLRQDFGVTSLAFTDSVFNDANGQYLLLVEELIRRKTDIRWCAFFRPNRISHRDIALMKRSGLYAMELGTDAACDTTLHALDKGFGFNDVLAVNQACADEKMPCAHFIMFGGPDETEASLRQGIENMKALGPAVVFAFSGIRILEGTGLKQRALADGLLDPHTSLLRPVYYFSPGIDADAMNAMLTKAFKGRRNRLFPPSESQLRLNVMRRFGFNGILWDRLTPFYDQKNAGGTR
jgi:lipid biosynthesis B12-binding/radical SAM protein